MAAFATILSIATYAGLVYTIPPRQCFANFNWKDCGKSPQTVLYYWKTGSRCEVGIWRGCLPNINMFKDEYECVSTCIFTVRAAEQDFHEINEMEDETAENIYGDEDIEPTEDEEPTEVEYPTVEDTTIEGPPEGPTTTTTEGPPEGPSTSDEPPEGSTTASTTADGPPEDPSTSEEPPDGPTTTTTSTTTTTTAAPSV